MKSRARRDLVRGPQEVPDGKQCASVFVADLHGKFRAYAATSEALLCYDPREEASSKDLIPPPGHASVVATFGRPLPCRLVKMSDRHIGVSFHGGLGSTTCCVVLDVGAMPGYFKTGVVDDARRDPRQMSMSSFPLRISMRGLLPFFPVRAVQGAHTCSYWGLDYMPPPGCFSGAEGSPGTPEDALEGGRLLLGGSEQQTCSVWDVSQQLRPRLLHTFPQSPATTFRLRRFRNRVFFGGKGPTSVFEYDMQRPDVLANRYEGHSSTQLVSDFALGGKGGNFADAVFTCGSDHQLFLFSTRTAQKIKAITLPNSGRVMYLAEDLNVLVVGTVNAGTPIQQFDLRKLDSPLSCHATAFPSGPSEANQIDNMHRIAEKTFVSGSFATVSMWSLDGKIIQERYTGRQPNGCCTIGTPYEFPEFGAGRVTVAELERIGFLRGCKAALRCSLKFGARLVVAIPVSCLLPF